ncbi:hypothetical protein KSP40_PGU012243 [Platanthera guangdongensis]|uniref:Uncharacterized protein n=1 Tax=Platanthera guangdongensis TaxID=2320717 RepID=A0ABR2LF44_9ASPA
MSVKFLCLGVRTQICVRGLWDFDTWRRKSFVFVSWKTPYHLSSRYKNPKLRCEFFLAFFSKGNLIASRCGAAVVRDSKAEEALTFGPLERKEDENRRRSKLASKTEEEVPLHALEADLPSNTTYISNQSWKEAGWPSSLHMFLSPLLNLVVERILEVVPRGGGGGSKVGGVEAAGEGR